VSSPPDESRQTAVGAATTKPDLVADDDAALVEQQAQIPTKLLLEEQAALVDVLAELFPGVMIARLSVPSLEYTFANAAFCLRFGELKRRDAAASNKVIGRTLAQVSYLSPIYYSYYSFLLIRYKTYLFDLTFIINSFYPNIGIFKIDFGIAR